MERRILESLPRAVVLRKFGEQNRTQDVTKQSHIYEIKHTNVETYQLDRK